ncbi:hypothetical protein GBA52_019972 [Prunus armeniaca]|nr:hypothetical protein GBA52_019972 [Prunus armeniaca]
MAPTFSPKLFFYVGKSGKLEITLFKDVIPHPVRILNVAGQLNFDGSVRNNLAASGFVICDSDGHVLLTGAKNIGDNTISVAECMALRDGLAYAIHRGWRNILVEGDPKLIIDRVKQEADPPWSICTLIQDIKLLSSFCVALSFNHIYREANFTADSVANLGHVLNPSKLWESGTPVHNSKGSRTHRDSNGVRRRPMYQMENFQKSPDDCNLSHIGFEGFPFTWSRKNGNGSVLWERLDRVVANTEFRHLWHQTKVHHLNSTIYDHKPIRLTLISQNISDALISARKRRFHFKTMWMKEKGFEDVVKEAWEYNVDEHLSVKEKLKRYAISFKNWEKDVFGSVRTQFCNVLTLQNNKVRGRLFLKERLTTCWKTRNYVAKKFKGVYNSKGKWCTDRRLVIKNFSCYFQSLFAKTGGYNIKVIIDMISPKVPDQMKHFLVKPYNRDEVEIALKQMPPSKAPRIDGMPAVFFQKYWHILGDEESVRSLNKTLIALIPKVEKPEFVTQYRPISLCNEIYKIISKTIANKIKCVLPMVIFENQSAFVPKRQISDNVTLAFETIHAMRKGFSAHLKHAEISGEIKGIEFERGPPPISHVIFADDNLHFLEATPQVYRTLKWVFEIY